MKAIKPIAYLRVFADAIEIIKKGNTSVLQRSTPAIVKDRVAKLQTEGYLVSVKHMLE